MTDFSPREIVSELDRFIVGQADAKRAVSIALRNRWRRLQLTGNGDVLEPEGGVAAIGSGGNYALAAARALSDYETDPEKIARRAMAVAAELCVFTNDRVTVETI